MSTTKTPLLTLSVLATAAMTANRFATLAGANAAAAATAPAGVCTRNAAIGALAPCDVMGTTTVEASDAIAKGALIEVATGGKAVTRNAGVVVARALEAAGADGDLIEVLLLPPTS